MMTYPLSEALGWTLTHSLWQSTLVATVFYLIRLIVRHQPTQVYTTALGSLLVIFGWSLYTFVNLYEPERAPTLLEAIHQTHDTLPGVAPQAAYTPGPLAKPTESFRLASFTAWIDQYTSLVAMSWLFGMVILSARLAGGLWYLKRLRHHRACPIPAWEAAVATLAVRLQLQRPVILLASSMAKVPMVIGHLKPIILLPVALISKLPPEQIEAIIAHEMAHIRRHDYVVNLLQSFIEVLFFYHPAVWWISSSVREEREKCCDDLVVSLGNPPLEYAKALAEAEVLQHTATPLVVAFVQRRGSLLSRIERLVHPRPSSTNLMAKAVALVPILLLITYLIGGSTFARRAADSEPTLKTSSFAAPAIRLPRRTESSVSADNKEADEGGRQQNTAKATTPVTSLEADTIPDEDEEPDPFSFHFGDSSAFSIDMNFNFDHDDSTYKKGFHHWQFSSNDTIPNILWNDSLWREYMVDLERSMNTFSEGITSYLEDSVDTEALQQQMNSVQRNLSRLQAELGTSLQRTFSDEKMKALQRKLQREQARLQRDLQKNGRQLQERQRQFQEEVQGLNEVHSKQMEELQQDLKEAEQRLNYRDNEESRQQLEEVQRALEEMQQRQQHQANDRDRAHAQMHNNFDNTVNGLEAALLADGLIKSGKEYRFELKPKGLYINRKKQSTEVLDKYRDLLKVSENTNFSITRTAR